MHTTPLQANKLLTPENSRYIRARCVVLQPGEEVGEHATGDMEEVVLILEGEAVVEAMHETVAVAQDTCVFIPPNTLHNILNRSTGLVRYVYVRSI